MNIGTLLILTMLFIVSRQSLKLVPERANATFVSKKYLGYGRAYINRSSRQSPYFLNIEGAILHTWANNVTLSIIFYEYLHNEYKRSFVEIHMKLCDLVNSDPYVGDMIRAANFTCPAPAGEYRLMNMTLNIKNFPSVLPFQKCRLNVSLLVTQTKEVIAEGYLYASFIQRIY